jgi:hypothetical protein
MWNLLGTRPWKVDFIRVSADCLFFNHVLSPWNYYINCDFLTVYF